MFSPRAEGRLDIQIPGAAQDRPSWTKVGVIAAVGFLVGVGWPRLAGVRLGPSLPSEVVSAAAAASGAAPAAAPSAAAPSVPAMASTPATAAPPAPAAAAASVTVGHGVVFSCKSSDGDALKGDECGALPGLDGLVMPRLRKLAECPEAATASGKLHLVARVDFGKGAIGLELGKGHPIPSADALLACARTDLAGATVAGVQHDNPRYGVAYTVTFAAAPATASTAEPAAAAPGHAPSPSPAAAEDGDASAQIVWEVAIVRDAPKTGKVVGRLQRGATVHLGAAKDGWYPVKFGDNLGSEGWLYRGAVGR